MPEVTLVAILDADKEGFLRSTRSIVQIAGRAARNVEGRIILYADTMTGSIERALEESGRRRGKQLAYNEERGITPRSAVRKIDQTLSPYYEIPPPADIPEMAEPAAWERGKKTPGGRQSGKKSAGRQASGQKTSSRNTDTDRLIILEAEMVEAAKRLDFERAAQLRDIIAQLKPGNGK